MTSTTRQNLKTLLTEELDPDKLMLGTVKATFEVTDYISNTEAEKYTLLKQLGVLFTVKQGQGTASRFLQGIAHTDKTDWEIGVWCVYSPQSETVKEQYRNLRDAAVQEIRRIFTANPAYGSEKNHRCDDRIRGTTTTLNSTLIFTKKTQT